MEYLIEVRWDDPIAHAVARVLGSVPEGLEQATGEVPCGQGSAFVVYRSGRTEVLDGLARALSALGARVRVTPVADSGVTPGEGGEAHGQGSGLWDGGRGEKGGRDGGVPGQNVLLLRARLQDDLREGPREVRGGWKRRGKTRRVGERPTSPENAPEAQEAALVRLLRSLPRKRAPARLRRRICTAIAALEQEFNQGAWHRDPAHDAGTHSARVTPRADGGGGLPDGIADS